MPSGAPTEADFKQMITTIETNSEIVSVLRDKNHPRHAELIADRSALYEAVYPNRKGETPVGFSETAVAEAKKKIAELETNKENFAIMRDKRHPRRADLLAERTHLYEAAYPSQES